MPYVEVYGLLLSYIKLNRTTSYVESNHQMLYKVVF
jgi:hypothetical protein